MVITVNNNITPEQVEKELRNRKPTKVIRTKKHLGKVKWGQDALAYQKKKRNEWG